MDILKKVQEFCDNELRDCEKQFWRNSMANHKILVTNLDCSNSAYHRCLGVVLFAQNLGAKYDDVNPIYQDFSKKMEELLDKWGK